MKRQPKPRCAKCKVNQAALDDAQKQFNETLSKIHELDDRLHVQINRAVKAEDLLQDAQMHARTNHKLLTEAKEEIERLRAICQDNIQDYKEEQEYAANLLKERADFAEEVENLQTDLRMQRELLINYNTRGNLVHWFGEFLLQKERGRFDVVSSRQDGGHV